MPIAAAVLLSVTGLQLGWTVVPATDAEPGSVAVTATLEEGDLVFVHESGREAASFEIVASLSGGGFARDGGTVVPSDLPSSRSIVIEGVEPGSHDLTLVFRDLESGAAVTRSARLDMPVRMSGSWSSSALQLSGGSSRVAGEVGFSWQVFQPSGEQFPDSLRAGYILRDSRGNAAAEGWMEPEGENRFHVLADISSLPSGEYDLLTAAILGTGVVAASALSLDIREDWDVWGHDAGTTARLVRPIATSQELDAIEDAGSEAARRAVMSEFWQSRDPNPMTRRNEYLEVYLERLDHVTRFSALGSPGITTDMGQVYALLGEPDIITDMPFETETLPYQVWTYFSPAITVLFVDRYGSGIYYLETPWMDIRRAYERR